MRTGRSPCSWNRFRVIAYMVYVCQAPPVGQLGNLPRLTPGRWHKKSAGSLFTSSYLFGYHGRVKIPVAFIFLGNLFASHTTTTKLRFASMRIVDIAIHLYSEQASACFQTIRSRRVLISTDSVLRGLPLKHYNGSHTHMPSTSGPTTTNKTSRPHKGPGPQRKQAPAGASPSRTLQGSCLGSAPDQLRYGNPNLSISHHNLRGERI